MLSDNSTLGLPSMRHLGPDREVVDGIGVAPFDFAANPNVPPALVHTLAKGAWIRAGQPVA
ncbi:hypothetical protein [Saccharothrix sp. ALI-22-I]|uniref:hypothetical protein n=1 Tax=Saccharothrix sp. ALI-22-I TaxID=1933778 RepID=UPI0023787AF0|nr:hypothetical protein [Saccharothrix sp. ALI-22-I]